METANSPVLSLLVPMLNEEAAVERFFPAVEAVLERLDLSYEILCIDDGSEDGTLESLKRHRARNPRIKIIGLSRNFGKEAALTAGLHHALGQAVIPMDVDLQDPPALIEQFVAQWRLGYEVVYGVRLHRGSDTPLKRLTAKGFYRFYNRMARVRIPEDTGDFRLMDRKVVEALKQLPERNRFMKGLFAWVGFKQIGIPYERPPRSAGMSAFGYWRLWNFALDGITSFCTTPLRVWTYLGVMIAIIAFLYGLSIVVRTWIHGIDVPGYPSLMVVVLFLGGLQMVTLGIIGEYLARMFDEVKGRPCYVIRETQGLDGHGG